MIIYSLSWFNDNIIAVFLILTKSLLFCHGSTYHNCAARHLKQVLPLLGLNVNKKYWCHQQKVRAELIEKLGEDR